MGARDTADVIFQRQISETELCTPAPPPNAARVDDSVIDPCVTRKVLTCAPVTLRTTERAEPSVVTGDTRDD